jgi:Tfp pilus assembly protein PilX
MRREEGSAYIIALLALVVLSIIGIGISLISQTERIIGSNDRMITRVLYAADSAISDAVARLVVFYDYEPRTFEVHDPTDSSDLIDMVNEVDVSWMLPILDAPCNLCQINQGSQFVKINHAMTVRAARKEAGSTDTQGIAARKVVAMVELQPRKSSIPPMNIDEENRGKIEF